MVTEYDIVSPLLIFKYIIIIFRFINFIEY